MPLKKKYTPMRWKRFIRGKWKGVFLGSIVVLSLVVLGATLFLVQRAQNPQTQAAYCSGAFNCSARCNDGHVTTDICPAYGAFGSCKQWAEEACAMRAGVKDMLSDGGVGGTFNDGSGGGSSATGETCPNNKVTAIHCRNQPVGTNVQGVCTCKKTSQGCGCFVTNKSSGTAAAPTPARVNASRCDTQPNPHQYCRSTFGEGNYCGRSGNNGNQFQCLPTRGRDASCNISAEKNAFPYNGEFDKVCSTGFKCDSGSCIPERASGRCPSGSDSECGAGNFCNNNGLCIAIRADGASCSRATQCQSGLCLNSVCSQKHGLNSVCADNTWCQSNFCSQAGDGSLGSCKIAPGELCGQDPSACSPGYGCSNSGPNQPFRCLLPSQGSG